MLEIKRRKRGPTPLPEKQKRKNFVRVYFTDVELNDVQHRAQHIKLPEFVRRAALDRNSDPIISVPPINLSAYAEIGKIGVNLNQIAYQLNATGRFDAARLDAELNKLVAARQRLLLGPLEGEGQSI